MNKAIPLSILLFLTPTLVQAECIERGLQGVKNLLDHLYQELGSPEPDGDSMERLDNALFNRDRKAEPKIDNDITVSYSSSEKGINGSVSCSVGENVITQTFEWEPDKALELGKRYSLE